MYTLKIKIDTGNRKLAKKIQDELRNKCLGEVLYYRGLFSSSEVILAIVAATPGIVATISGIIQNYVKHNEGKTVTIENSKGKRSYIGYSVEEVKELEGFLMEDGKEADK